jgi:hypothetical protein
MSKNAEIIGLSDLKPDPQNARKHTPRNVAMVVKRLLLPIGTVESFLGCDYIDDVCAAAPLASDCRSRLQIASVLF